MRWQAARIVGALPMRTHPRADHPPRTIFKIAASGGGRRWLVDQPQAFWRDFAEFDLNNADAVLGFVQRRGDPFGVLDAGGESDTGHWTNLKALLSTASQAWDPAGANGVSRIASDTKRIRLAEHFLRSNPQPYLDQVKTVLADDGPRITAMRAETLAAFMVLSAADAVERRIPMRRCDHCASWLEFTRNDARFCSASCRSLHSQKQRKEK